jgi:hypothetical protein
VSSNSKGRLLAQPTVAVAGLAASLRSADEQRVLDDHDGFSKEKMYSLERYSSRLYYIPLHK